MGGPRNLLSKGKTAGRKWRRRLFHQSTRETGNQNLGQSGERSIEDNRCSTSSPAEYHSDNSLAKTSSSIPTSRDTSVQTRGSTDISRPCSPKPSKLSQAEKSKPPDPSRSLVKTHRRTFPLSKKEKENDPVTIQVPGRRGRKDIIYSELEERKQPKRQRRLLPVPENFVVMANRQELKKLTEEQNMEAIIRGVSGEALPPSARALEESERWRKLWQNELLPSLVKALEEAKIEDEWNVYSMSGKEPGERVIFVMTAQPMKDTVRAKLEGIKSKYLKQHDSDHASNLDSRIKIKFSVGKTEYLASSDDGNSSTKDDPCPPPRNTQMFQHPAIGDSVGWGKSGTASLGPTLKVDDKFFRLVCWHLFDDRDEDDDKDRNRHWCETNPPRQLEVYHPSQDDKSHNERTTGQGSQAYIGEVKAYSGQMYNTSRLSKTLGSSGQVKTVTDWALVEETTHTVQPNIVRREGSLGSGEWDITETQDPEAFMQACDAAKRPHWVYSVRRTSGYSIGQLSETPGANWISNGAGKPGDSGAGVFGFFNNKLLGQIWGRNVYEAARQEPRITFFTPMSDIFNDIGERFPCKNIQLATEESIPAEMYPYQDLAYDEICLGIGSGPLVASSPDRRERAAISVGEDEQDTGEEDLVLRSRVSRHSSLRMPIIRHSSIGDGQGNHSLQRWARVIMHAATF
ncbi:hypothetical protein F5Y16DRAFT_269998 [Xylariaceae sp. FL0255]|nr:hypothetical protein F5Y16DRAFT_269998 [Xylariaceae sp. FL0255]